MKSRARGIVTMTKIRSRYTGEPLPSRNWTSKGMRKLKTSSAVGICRCRLAAAANIAAAARPNEGWIRTTRHTEQIRAAINSLCVSQSPRIRGDEPAGWTIGSIRSLGTETLQNHPQQSAGLFLCSSDQFVAHQHMREKKVRD